MKQTRGQPPNPLLHCLVLAACSYPADAVSMPRAHLLRGSAAALAAVPLSAIARSKATVAPNKVEGVGANAGQYMSEYRKKEYEGIRGDKGVRGVASKDFDANDTVQKNRKQNGGLARDASARNRSPAELGLKQWDGS